MVGSRSSSRTRARALRWPTPLTQLCCCGELASKNAPPLLPSTGVPRGPAPQEGVPQPLRRAPVRAGELRCVGEQREGVMCALLLRLVRVAPRARARAQCAATESCAAACAHTVHHSRSSSHPLTPPPCTTNRIPTTAPGAQARARHHHHEHWRAGDALGCAERLALPTLFFSRCRKEKPGGCAFGGRLHLPLWLAAPLLPCPAPAPRACIRPRQQPPRRRRCCHHRDNNRARKHPVRPPRPNRLLSLAAPPTTPPCPQIKNSLRHSTHTHTHTCKPPCPLSPDHTHPTLPISHHNRIKTHTHTKRPTPTPPPPPGAKTGRSPRDKRVVREPSTEKDVWWAAPGSGSPNFEIDER